MARERQKSSRGVPRKARKTSALSAAFRESRTLQRKERQGQKRARDHKKRIAYFKARRERFGGVNLSELRRSIMRSDLCQMRERMGKTEMSLSEFREKYGERV